ncbi:hypothetical protein AXG93_3022s1110 [Marchantia polymorpha subsp. ruderalis]|uniref:Reverse transcriptase domain-containing protein n=1 Tax=Marchantia polymorpha subsp. ruderalis TaxID=1480154 RepID=A0A176VE76_MARPO|nr:hypothetical protein AXG93_3022s1110 [Marchantia polymorpha subsp. ruderalis]
MSMAIQACSSGLQLCRFPLGQELARGNEWKGANFPTQVLRKRRAAAGVEFLRFSSCAGFVVSQTSPGNEGLGIVITGGTSGLGFALARNFLEPKDRVSKGNGKVLFCAFIDFKKAFDTVPRELLWERLQVIGVPSDLLAAVATLYHSV